MRRREYRGFFFSEEEDIVLTTAGCGMGEIEDDRRDVNTCELDEMARGTCICDFTVFP